ncbi:DEAD/DEAH box helicase [Shewanella aestuarii]|uniref:DEAD/DEAH box helicase n=1 Tax=Shewanella aestuarii TaxID=1028752 RepID=A0A6G9QNK4_9GAMM|nr:DEAD/DEAH box helicase [Shewanella aestuarii]QIR15663.1 DEAD/DEAH box helicase [Shewanella aestuarii]
MSFESLGLKQPLLSCLAELNYAQATPIQTQAIPIILQGQDVMAGAQTGTGKTAAFCLPLIQMILAKKHNLAKQSAKNNLANEQVNSASVTSASSATAFMSSMLVLTPTRELAQQVFDNVCRYTRGSNIQSALLYGGVSSQSQIKQLTAGVDIIVATPGRLLDLVRQRATSLSQINHLVIDEADRMLDMGFKDEIIDVLKRVPKQRQTLLFSATLDDRMFSFSKRLLTSPKVIEVSQRNTTAATIVERVFNVDANNKPALLAKLIKQENWQQVLVFSRTRQGADALATTMAKLKVNAAALHADMSQAQREQVLSDFKANKLTALIATDVAARGLDIAKLNYVVNMELPFKLEDYVHRIGRTGRAGQEGQAITLLSIDDEPLLIKLETYLDRRLPQQWYPGFEPDLTQVAPVTRKTKKGSLKQQARQKALAQSKRK